VTFACRSSNSYPQADIAWFKNSFPMMLDSNAHVQTNLTYELNANNEFDTISYLSFDVISSDHLREVRCDVKVGTMQRVMHGSIILDVKFGPEVINKLESVYTTTENATFSLNLTSRANPEPTYKCLATNKKNYTVVNNTIKFQVERTDNTDFTCEVKNSENSLNIQFKLDVKYSPSAKVQKPLYVTSVGESVQLSCTVSGNPIARDFVTWKLNKNALVNSDYEQYYSVKFVPPNLSVLTIEKVRDIDDGNFTCHVDNKIGKGAEDLTELRVKRKPVITVDKSILKVGVDGNTNKNATFECRARAYPDVKFKWIEPKNKVLTNSAKYSMEEKKTESQTFVTVLTIINVVSNDYGSYLCVAHSEMGNVTEKAILSGKHQPEQPSEFRVLNITRNAIMLQWKKNFDGGDPQKFRIRYRKDTMDPTYRYVETDTDVSSVLLDNLETATRYVVNIQSLNKFGTDGFLRDPLIVQTDFGFNEVNQMPIYNGNNLPLAIILVVCGVGTLLLLFNVALIVYLIKRKKKKGEAGELKCLILCQV